MENFVKISNFCDLQMTIFAASESSISSVAETQTAII